jgi:hypothetical protein
VAKFVSPDVLVGEVVLLSVEAADCRTAMRALAVGWLRDPVAPRREPLRHDIIRRRAEVRHAREMLSVAGLFPIPFACLVRPSSRSRCSPGPGATARAHGRRGIGALVCRGKTPPGVASRAWACACSAGVLRLALG